MGHLKRLWGVWGIWSYEQARNQLVAFIPDYPEDSNYVIDLDRCKTSAQKCDWLAQIAEKDWATLEILGGLVLALDSVVGLRPGSKER